jgi:hypothetical protein
MEEIDISINTILFKIKVLRDLVSHLNDDLSNDSISDIDKVMTQKIVLKVQTRMNNYVNKYDRWSDMMAESVDHKAGSVRVCFGGIDGASLLSIMCIFIS